MISEKETQPWKKMAEKGGEPFCMVHINCLFLVSSLDLVESEFHSRFLLSPKVAHTLITEGFLTRLIRMQRR